jgi:hypothetical protein
MVSFYFDQHVPAAVTNGLRLRGVNVLTAYEDGRSDADDISVLERATALSRVLVTQDEDFLALGARWLAERKEFSGIVYAHQLRIAIGRFIADLELIAKSCDFEQTRNHIEHLPL